MQTRDPARRSASPAIGDWRDSDGAEVRARRDRVCPISVAAVAMPNVEGVAASGRRRHRGDDGASGAPGFQLAGILASARSPRPGAFRRDELRTLADDMRAFRAFRGVVENGEGLVPAHGRVSVKRPLGPPVMRPGHILWD